MTKAKAAPKLTNAQRLLLEQVTGKGFAAIPEYVFHPTRKWRIDVAVSRHQFAFPGQLVVAVEIDGGAYIAGRHTRGAGVEADNEKIAALAAAGFRFIRVTPKQVMNGTALAWIQAAL